MGHPSGSMDIGTLRYFQVPGQDLVWRYVEPGPKALNGPHSTMAKGASSAMIHLGHVGTQMNCTVLMDIALHSMKWSGSRIGVLCGGIIF